MIRERDETSFLQEAHIARRVLDTFAQRFDNFYATLSSIDLDQKQFALRLNWKWFEFMDKVSMQSHYLFFKCFFNSLFSDRRRKAEDLIFRFFLLPS